MGTQLNRSAGVLILDQELPCPFLAVADDRSALLSLSNYGVGFDWGILAEAVDWLAHDFAPTGESLRFDLSTVRDLLDTTFAGRTEFGLVTFDLLLGLNGLQLSLSAQVEADRGPEYLIQGFGSYQRFYRDPEEIEPVMPSERIMLDGCVSAFAEFAGRCVAKLTEPPPPRYRCPLARELVN